MRSFRELLQQVEECHDAEVARRDLGGYLMGSWFRAQVLGTRFRILFHDYSGILQQSLTS